MAGIRPHAQRASGPVREILRAHLRTVLPVGLVVLVGILVVAVLAGTYAAIIGATAYTSLVASINSIDTWTTAVTIIMIPLVLLALLASLVWAGTVTQAASAAVDKKQTWMPSAAWTALRRAPKAIAVIVVTAAAAIGAVLAAPVFLVVGVVGLVTHRGRRELLIPMAIPFGVAVLVLVRWSLALPAVWLDGFGVRASLAESSRRVKGRGTFVALTLIATLIVNFGISAAVTALVTDSTVQLVIQIAALILFGAIPFVALAVLYRRGPDDQPSAMPAPPSRRARVAVAVIVSMIVPFAIVGVPASASAAGTAVSITADFAHTVAGEEVTLTAQVTGNSPTGNVTFDAVPTSGPDYVIATVPIDGTGKAMVQDFHIPVGTYGIVAQYAGDGNNPAANSAPLPHTVSFASTTLDVTANPTWTASATTLTMTVSAVAPAFLAPTGTVTVSGNGHTYGPVALTSLDVTHPGVATLPIDVTTIGTRDVTITYSGDDAYATNSTSFSVPKIPTTTTVAGDTARGATYGDSETFSGTVTAADHSLPTGTVNLIWYNNAVVASATLDASGGFSITTDKLRVSSQNIFLVYAGDANHAESDNSATQLIHLDVNKDTSVPVVSVDPLTPTVGSAVEVTATLADVGDGPSGTVTFTDQHSQVMGTAPVAGGKAALTFNTYLASTLITAAYSGDINFTAATSAQYQMDATPAAVAVSLTDPGDLTYGQLFDFSATVSVAGGALTPNHGVDFTTTGGSVLDSAVPVVAGKATISACAGAVADCPSGTVALGAADSSIIATYSATPLNQLGRSAAYDYEPGKATTTTSLTVTPSPTVLYGSAVFLSATVAATNPAVTPTGSVSFYGVEPAVGGGSPSLDFLGSGELVDGVALLTTSHANGLDELRWPANQVEAQYSPGGANFKSSTDLQSITLARIGVSLDVTAVTQPAGTRTPITVTLSHDPGASEDYTGQVTVTADTGGTCSAFPAAGQRQVTCDILWTTVGTHTVTAAYSGDVVYLPGSSGVVTVGSSKRTPALGATVVSAAVVGANVTLTWNQFDPAATGTVTVWGDGTQWCSVPVQTLSCTGQFTDASATGSPVAVVVQYTGDSTWNAIEEDRGVLVSKCATLDVHSTASALGTVQVTTAPNCGSGGYAAGTTISVTATVIAPAVFVHWLEFNTHSGNLVPGANTLTTAFVVTNDSLTWVHEAVFQIPCSAVTASATGYGSIRVTPSSNCTTNDGDPGYLYGTPVVIYPDGQYNPRYGEADAFRAFGTLPSGVSVARDKYGELYLTLTVIKATVVPLSFGPQCRPVTYRFNPSSTGDGVTGATPLNCFSPFGDGYVNGTRVTATVQPGDPSLVITSWSLNGTIDPALGTTNAPTIVIETVAPVLTANLVHCYTVNAVVDGVTDNKDNPVGDVRVDGPPNCPDGSARYLTGTQVTLTPEVLVNGGQFNGWDNDVVGAGAPAGGTGDVTRYVRTIVVTSNILTTAGFYLASACSRLTLLGDQGLVSFDNTGCGPGYYADLQKQVAINDGVEPSTLWQDKYHTPITANLNRVQKLDLYASVRGDVRSCFGTIPSTSGPSPDGTGWKTYGPLQGDAPSCNIAGTASIWTQACQTVVTTPSITVDGDATAATYDASSLPGTLYLVGADGVVSDYATSDFRWAQLIPIDRSSNGKLSVTDVPPGPCHDTPGAFPADTDLLLGAAAPSNGFAFDGWTGRRESGLYTVNPIEQVTDDTQRSLTNTAHYTVSCHTVTLGEGISIVGDAPRCPGSSAADKSYIADVAIQVKAIQHIGNRIITKFNGSVIADQITKDPASGDLTGFVVIDGDQNVSATYLTNGQYLGIGIAKGLKTVLGVAAVAAPILLGAVFPPAGILFAVLGAGAGIANLIPGGGKVAAVFELLNPTAMTTCIARWSFNNAGDPTGGKNIGAIGKTVKTLGKEGKSLYDGGPDVDSIVAGAADDIKLGEILGTVGSVAGFEYGLYSAGIMNVNVSNPQTVAEVNDTSTMTGCLDDQWKAAGANVG